MTPGSAELIQPEARRQEILSAQVRLLYANANVGIAVTLFAAALVGRLQWATISHSVIVGWWVYMAVVSAWRQLNARQFRSASPKPAEVDRWRTAFAVGSGFAGAGWGGAGVLLYPEAHLSNQVFLVFVLGGMMLGAASLLAPRIEAYLAFLIPTGMAPAIRFLVQGDETHVAMGLLSVVFTVATLVTTGRIYRTVESSITLQFANRDLVVDLQAAKHQTEELNQVLEWRVEERTAELHKSTEQLRNEIAQREAIEEELIRARKLESLGLLAGGIAHDFNNFLTVVQGNVEMAKSYLDPGGPVHQILDQTTGAFRRATFLSSQLLTFAKGGAPVRRVVSVAKLVADAVQLARAGATVSIAVHMPDDLRSVQVDPGQIGQVLHNILLNARQAMPEGGIIEVRAENVNLPEDHSAEPVVRISIRDYGCGIPADVLPQIFDPYFTTKVGASGLGLATSYAIVAKHGGHISVESNPGDGTVFSIDLPATHEVPAPQTAQAQAAVRIEGGSARLLVMDDEVSIRKLLKTLLTQLGYKVETARDGAEAIALYEEARNAGRRFDAVLLDLTVSGGMGGLETATKLKEIDPASRLIVSSGYSDAPVMSDFARYGFAAVIPKPWSMAELGEVFRTVLVADPERKAD